MAFLLLSFAPAQAKSGSALYEPRFVETTPGHRIHIACVGRGAPTLLFLQGGEGSIANWRKVRPAASALTRTCFYDRSGFGLSDPTEGPIDGLSATDELHTLLRQARISRPLVLVGHSIGGFYATL